MLAWQALVMLRQGMLGGCGTLAALGPTKLSIHAVGLREALTLAGGWCAWAMGQPTN